MIISLKLSNFGFYFGYIYIWNLLMPRNFNDLEFANVISKRTITNSFSVALFSKGAECFTVKYISDEGGEVENTYLAVKMIGIEKESLWLGYKVKNAIGEEKVEIDITKLLWIYIDSTILKKQIRVNQIQEFSVATLCNENSGLPIKIGDNAKNIDYHARCIAQLNNSINDLYSKARIHSYLKMLSNFAIYEYDFLKSEYADENLRDSEDYVLKSRFMPLIIKNDKLPKPVNGISVFINSLKDGNKHVGLWICAPLDDNGFINLDKISLVAGLSSRNISVNTSPASSGQLEVKPISKEVLESKEDSDLAEWVSGICDKFKVSKFVASTNVKDFVEKFDKSKDLFSEEFVSNVYFTNIEEFANNLISLSDAQAKDVKILVKPIKVKNVSNSVEKKPSEINIDQDQVDEVGSKTLTTTEATTETVNVTPTIPQSETIVNDIGSTEENDSTKESSVSNTPVVDEILKESVDVDGYWDVVLNTNEELVFKHTLMHCSVTFLKQDMLSVPNKIYNEMLSLSIDPYTVKDAFENIGYKFKQYGYVQVRKLISEVDDEILDNYIGLENYYDLVQAEKYNRSLKKG